MTATVEGLFGGSLLGPVPDPYPVYRRLRTESPVLSLSTPLGLSHLVTRYDDVSHVLRTPELFSSRSNARGIGIVMGRTFLELDGAEHLQHRRLVAGFFSPRSIAEGLPALAGRVAHELIDEFANDGRADLVAQFTFTFSMRVIAEVIGVPIDDYGKFHSLAQDIVCVGEDPARGFAASEEIRRYLEPIVVERQRRPQDDPLSQLVRAEVDGVRLELDDVINFLRLLLPAGAETTFRLLGTCLHVALAREDVMETVSANPSARSSLIEETLRWESPVQWVSREAVDTTVLGDTMIPAGSLISVSVGSANRDERHYADPDRFDLSRDNQDHLAFGFGPHFCAGSHVARIETNAALDALFNRLHGLRSDPSAPSSVVGLAFRSPPQLTVLFDPTASRRVAAT